MKKIVFMIIISLSICTFLYSTDFKKNLQKGINLYNQESYEEALEIFKKLYSYQPNNTVLNYFIGITYRKMEFYQLSIPYLLKAVTLKPKIKDAIIPLIDSYYRVGNYKNALQWIKVAEKLNISKAKILFLKGLIAVKLKKYKDAIYYFNQAKKLDKSLTQACDFQIAGIYLRMNKFKEAKARLKSVIIYNPNTDLAYFARDYLNFVKKKLAMRKNWKFYLGFNYKYDSNVRLEPSIILPKDRKYLKRSRKEDNGFTSIGSVTYIPNFNYTTPFSLNVNYTILFDNYFKLNGYDTVSHSIGITPGYRFKRFLISIPLSYTYSWVGEKEYSERLSSGITLRFLITKNNLLDVVFEYNKENYFSKTISEYSDRDSNIYLGGFNYFYFFKNGNGLFNLKFRTGHADADGKYWSKNVSKISFNLLYPIIDKLNFQGAFNYTRDKYDHRMPAVGKYRFEMKKRDDYIYDYIVALNYQFNEIINFYLQYTHTYSNSNIPVYHYRKNVCSLGMEFRW